MSITIEQFQKDGWKLTEEGLNLLKEWTEVEEPTFEHCLQVALNSDLKQFCKGEIGKEMPSTISPPHVLQLQEVVNIAAPLQHQVEHPRMLRAVFTDGGKKKIKGVEMHGKVDGLKLNTPPGTKFVVTKDITVEEDLLMLGHGVLKNIGGHVESMVNEWKASKQYIMRSSKAKKDTENNDNDDGPPPFVSYKLPTTVEKPRAQESKSVDKPHQKATKTDSNKENAVPSANASTKAKSKGGKGSERPNAKDKKKSTVVEPKEGNKDSEISTQQQRMGKDPSAVKGKKGNTAKISKGIKKEEGSTKQVHKPNAKKNHKNDAKVNDASASLGEEPQIENLVKESKEAKAPKSKRPEQKYYTPKPRVPSESAPSNAGDHKDAPSMGLSIDGTRRMNIPRQAASADTEHGKDNDNIGNGGAQGRGRGRGRGRGQGGRGRGQRGRGRGLGGDNKGPTYPSQ
ncbi:hypothetical protein INT43_003089 [Umbelopsis isabellina]|uniref:RecQ-mediated genome instability protein 1 n=1 Tax=Mortierella isabellina TaxID=91625 RepID=A0A8H7PPI8_MORIS|nr:hypothetical protein INT43_003089 [Umbelopsis isabellina]